jgi:hypothetical protein
MVDAANTTPRPNRAHGGSRACEACTHTELNGGNQ